MSSNNHNQATNHALQASTGGSHRQETNSKKGSGIIESKGNDLDHHQLHENASAANRVPPQPVEDGNESDYKEWFKLKLRSTSGCLPIPCCGFCNLWCSLRWQICVETLVHVGLLCALGFGLGFGATGAEAFCNSFKGMKEACSLWVVALVGLVASVLLFAIFWNFMLWRGLRECKANYFLTKLCLDVVLVFGCCTISADGGRIGIGTIFSLFYLWRMYKVYSWAKYFENGGQWDWKIKQD